MGTTDAGCSSETGQHKSHGDGEHWFIVWHSVLRLCNPISNTKQLLKERLCTEAASCSRGKTSCAYFTGVWGAFTFQDKGVQKMAA